MSGADRLYYLEDVRFRPVPDWCLFFAQAGLTIGETSLDRQIVTAISVPIRAFAAAFVGLGLTIAISSSQIPIDQHMGRLAKLEIGTPVFLRNDSRKVKGIFLGLKPFPDGVTRIGVQLQNPEAGGLANWLPINQAFRVRSFESSSLTSAELPRSPKEIDLSRHQEFVSQILPIDTIRELERTSVFEFVIVGSANVLRQEIKETPFAVKRSRSDNADRYFTGNLQAILRVRRFSTENDTFRSEIISTETGSPKLPNDNKPKTVVFDGARGFLKWRTYWPHSNWVVVLDRTESYFSDAVAVLNESYSSRVGEWNALDRYPIPEELELTSHLVEA